MNRLLVALFLVATQAVVTNALGQVVHEEVEGIRNFAQIESVVACAGTIMPESVGEIRDRGFRSIINLQLARERGAHVEEESSMAAAIGIQYVHLPLAGPDYDPAVADRFLEVIVDPGMAPAFIHCASGGRAATMWFVKRVMVDGWDIETALEEAVAMGMNPESPTGEFGLRYVALRSP